LTRERNVDLIPDSEPGDANLPGHGTACAAAAALAAPEAKLLLVRIDPATPFMLKTALEYIFGEYALSPDLARRHDDLLQAKALKGADAICCSLVWNDGYPLGARSTVTKWLDDKLRPEYVPTASGKKVVKVQKPLWFQAAGNTRGQSWQALCRDADQNGVMEF